VEVQPKRVVVPIITAMQVAKKQENFFIHNLLYIKIIFKSI